MKGDRQKCLEAGASDYIAKPVDLDLLLALLRVWVGRSRSRGRPSERTAATVDCRHEPRCRSAMQTRLEREAASGDRSAAPAAPTQARVLAVDDDERNLLAISEVLDETAEVVCAQSGEEALRLLLKEEFAVILLDVLMPGLDGYETASLIRQREQSKRTPIIFLTAINKEDAHMLRGYDAGAVDYVFKPFDPVMLRSKVSVFVELFEKTREIQQKAALEQQPAAGEPARQRREAGGRAGAAASPSSARRRSCGRCRSASMRAPSTPPFGALFRQRSGRAPDRLSAGAASRPTRISG